MGENTSQIEQQITSERAELGRNLDALESKARDLADWRVHYRNHPGVFLGAAAGIGLALGALSHRRESFGYVDYAHPPERREPREPRRPLSARFQGPKGRRVVETWEHITDALLAVATSKAVDLISDYMPRFGDEYRRLSGEGDSASRRFWDETSNVSGRPS